MQTWKAVVATLVAVGTLAALAGATVVHLGLYDIAATTAHTQPVYELLETAMKKSVQRHARDVVVPPSLDTAARVQRGAACYRARCAQCHGGPGGAGDAAGLAMQPLPGSLIAAARAWRARELYWIARHGIKMTGMPAWQHHSSDEDLWAVVAFLRRLPALTPDVYAELTAPGPDCSDAGDSGAPADPAGRAERGRLALRMYGCQGCHSIPGIPGPRPQVGPPLDGFASGQLIAGRLANTHDNLVAWIRDPKRFDPRTAMPDQRVTQAHAEDMAAYLMTLR